MSLRGASRPQAFSKAHRLLKAGEFDRVFKQGKRLSAPELTLAFRQRPSREGQVHPPRLGLSVSKKVGGAVQRNLVKRRIREIFRKNRENIENGSEFVFIPRKNILEMSFLKMNSMILDVFSRTKLYKSR